MIALPVTLAVLLALGSIRRRPRLSAETAAANRRRRWLQRTRRTHPTEQWARTFEILARSVRSGSTLDVAIREACSVPQGAALAPVVQRLDRGDTVADAVTGAGTSPGNRSDRFALSTLALTAHHGGELARAFDAASAAMRAELVARAERAAQSAQARMSALVLSALPVAVGIWTALTDARARSVWFDWPLGPTLFGVGLSLNLGGWWWMARIVGTS